MLRTELVESWNVAGNNIVSLNGCPLQPTKATVNGTGRKNGFTRVTKVQQKCSKYHICRNLLKFAEEQRLILH